MTNGPNHFLPRHPSHPSSQKPKMLHRATDDSAFFCVHLFFFLLFLNNFIIFDLLFFFLGFFCFVSLDSFAPGGRGGGGGGGGKEKNDFFVPLSLPKLTLEKTLQLRHLDLKDRFLDISRVKIKRFSTFLDPPSRFRSSATLVSACLFVLWSQGNFRRSLFFRESEKVNSGEREREREREREKCEVLFPPLPSPNCLNNTTRSFFVLLLFLNLFPDSTTVPPHERVAPAAWVTFSSVTRTNSTNVTSCHFFLFVYE